MFIFAADYRREKNKVIVVTGTELLGELSFTIDVE
jgi:hypothetical protein